MYCSDTAANGKVADTFTSIHEAPLHYSGRGHGRDAPSDGVPPENVLQEIDAQELNRMFVRRLASSRAYGPGMMAGAVGCSMCTGRRDVDGTPEGLIALSLPSRLLVWSTESLCLTSDMPILLTCPAISV